jgi:hypothetical protein
MHHHLPSRSSGWHMQIIRQRYDRNDNRVFKFLLLPTPFAGLAGCLETITCQNIGMGGFGGIWMVPLLISSCQPSLTYR